MTREYWALTVAVAAEAADAVTDFLWEAGAAGVVEEPDGATGPTLRAFFPPPVAPAETRDRLARYLDDLRALAVPVGSGAVTVQRVPEEAWADAWRAHFRPIPVGRRLLIRPPWDAGAGDGQRTVVLIEPGRAFGTGGHATTQGALELVERALAAAPVSRVLDVGTGSGILAIAAARLGAPAVAAIDVDSEAVAAAIENAAQNGVADRVRVAFGGPETWAEPPADLVVANLLGAELVRLAPALARCCARPGRLIAAGLLSPETPVVAGSFVPEGFALAEVVEHEGWASLLLVR